MSFVSAKKFPLRIHVDKPNSANMPGGTIVKNSRPSRGIIACGLLGAFLFMMTVSAAPRLHERFHDTDDVGHHCAVTMFISGNFEHAPSPQITITAPKGPLRPVVVPVQLSIFACAAGRSILEHAPPALA